jgi:hypothetical protein
MAIYLPMEVTYEDIDDRNGQQNEDSVTCYVLVKVEHILNKCRKYELCVFCKVKEICSYA